MSIYCEYAPIQGHDPDPHGYWYRRCIHCGELSEPHLATQFPVERKCLRPDDSKVLVPLPPYLARAAHYLIAWARHKARGTPMVGWDVLIARYRHCSRCPLYNDLQGACSVCGCLVNLLHQGQGANLLQWADADCPHDPPYWLANVPSNQQAAIEREKLAASAATVDRPADSVGGQH